jgi:hypothetical protein
MTKNTKQIHYQNSLKIQSKIVENEGKIDTPNTYKHDCLLSYLGTDISKISYGAKWVLWATIPSTLS